MPKRKRTPTYAPRKRRRVFKKRTAPYRMRKRRFTKAVKKLIQNTAEVKRTSSNPQTYTFNADNSAMSAPVDIPQLFCAMAQGTGDGDRIGEQIRTKKAVLKVLVQAGLPNPSAECQILQLFIGKFKSLPGTPPTAAQLTGIFDDGSGTAAADGTLLSLLRSINSDMFTIYRYKRVKVGNSTAAGFTNNEFPAYRTFSIDVTKHLGLLKYNGELVSSPTNKHFYMFCNWVNPDGTTPDAQPPRVQYYLDFTYTDQ